MRRTHVCMSVLVRVRHNPDSDLGNPASESRPSPMRRPALALANLATAGLWRTVGSAKRVGCVRQKGRGADAETIPACARRHAYDVVVGSGEGGVQNSEEQNAEHGIPWTWDRRPNIECPRALQADPWLAAPSWVHIHSGGV